MISPWACPSWISSLTEDTFNPLINENRWSHINCIVTYFWLPKTKDLPSVLLCLMAHNDDDYLVLFHISPSSFRAGLSRYTVFEHSFKIKALNESTKDQSIKQGILKRFPNRWQFLCIHMHKSMNSYQAFIQKWMRNTAISNVFTDIRASVQWCVWLVYL